LMKKNDEDRVGRSVVANTTRCTQWILLPTSRPAVALSYPSGVEPTGSLLPSCASPAIRDVTPATISRPNPSRVRRLGKLAGKNADESNEFLTRLTHPDAECLDVRTDLACELNSWMKLVKDNGDADALYNLFLKRNMAYAAFASQATSQATSQAAPQADPQATSQAAPQAAPQACWDAIARFLGTRNEASLLKSIRMTRVELDRIRYPTI
jgi:hypothetical protein